MKGELPWGAHFFCDCEVGGKKYEVRSRKYEVGS
jgi:hypothetical protein